MILSGIDIIWGVQVLAGLQYSLPAPDMGGLTQQQTQWVLAALAAQGQQQLLPSVSAALGLTHTNPAGLFSHFPASQLQVPSPHLTLQYVKIYVLTDVQADGAAFTATWIISWRVMR